jgi:hypothetical protein
MPTDAAAWPALPLASWEDTRATLHMWTQVVGKIRLALASPVNHWWHVTLTPTARGLTTLPMPYDDGVIDMTFDFVDHRLVIEVGDGRRRVVALAPKSVATFYAEVRQALADLRVAVRIWPVPVEVPDPIRFDEDHRHASYDAESVERWWRALSLVDTTFKEFRGGFLGKCSPVHFFWGSFDLAATRFNGRQAPERPGADAITREAYSHEVISAGFWPGSGAMSEPAFYAYAAPEPPGFKTAGVAPAGAFYSNDFNEFLLRYEDVRTAPSPHEALMAFLQTTYEAGATLGAWDRRALEKG